MTKFLVNSDFKVIRKGEFVKADEAIGEFIMDSESNDLAASTLREIASANKIAVPKKANNQTLTTTIAEAIMTDQNIPEQNQPTETDKATEIVKAGFDAGKNDDEIMVELVTSGISFKKAAKLFKQVAETLGARVSSKDRNAQAAELLADMEFNPATSEDVLAAAKTLSEKIKDTTEKQALTVIKKYAKDHEIELPEVQKAKRTGGGGGHGFRGAAFDWIVSNPEATREQFIEFIASNEKPEAVQNRLAGIFDLVHQFHNTHKAA